MRTFSRYKKTAAQIVVATHNIDLLDLELLRRDQIWFTSLTGQGRSAELYSLASLPAVRKDSNLKKLYLESWFQKRRKTDS